MQVQNRRVEVGGEETAENNHALLVALCLGGEGYPWNDQATSDRDTAAVVRGMKPSELHLRAVPYDNLPVLGAGLSPLGEDADLHQLFPRYCSTAPAHL